jgi:hypothetical protein
LAAVRSEIDRMMSEYQDLMEIKVKLDMEINAYRALLEEEETRWVKQHVLHLIVVQS